MSNSEVDLSVLIVTYNSAPFVLDCIRAVQHSVCRHSFEIIVADNASADDSVATVRKP